MSNYKISRRHLLTGAGTVFTLPLLESLFPFSTAYAQAANDPRRYVCIYYPNGSYNLPENPLWVPPQTGLINASNTTDLFRPFSSFYGDFSVMTGLRNRARRANPEGDDHQASAQSYLTAASTINSSTNSFEHVLATRFSKPAIVLHGGDPNFDQPADAFISYRNGQGMRGITNPGDLYRQLLGQVVPSMGTPQPAPAPMATNNNKSIIDSSLADLNNLMGKVGRNDKLRLDEYLTGIRTLERKVAAAPAPSPTPTPSTGGSAACTTPMANAAADTNQVTNPNLLLTRFYAFNDLIKIAFACDITRSVSLMVGPETTQQTFPNAPDNLVFNGVNIGGGLISHTAISHCEQDVPLRRARICTRDRYLFQIVTDLITKLKSAQDPSGSRIFDNTIISAGFGVADGNHGGHGVPRYDDGGSPFVLAGGRNFMSTGNHYVNNTNDIADLFFTINSFVKAGLTTFQGSSTILKI